MNGVLVPIATEQSENPTWTVAKRDPAVLTVSYVSGPDEIRRALAQPRVRALSDEFVRRAEEIRRYKPGTVEPESVPPSPRTLGRAMEVIYALFASVTQPNLPRHANMAATSDGRIQFTWFGKDGREIEITIGDSGPIEIYACGPLAFERECKLGLEYLWIALTWFDSGIWPRSD